MLKTLLMLLVYCVLKELEYLLSYVIMNIRNIYLKRIVHNQYVQIK